MNKQKAFTLVEILIVLGIVGVITTIGLNAFRNHDTGIRYLYSNIYNSLDKAIYNATNFTDLASPFDADVANDNQRVERLCRMLIQYINPIDEAAACNVDDNHIISLNAIMEGNGDTSHEEFTTKRPLFVATNGVSFYISAMQNEDENQLRYFVVFADTNNTKSPNSLIYTPGRVDPDIFAFAILDIGRACPLGPPEIDPKFMLTRISYQVLDDNNEEATLAFSRQSNPYFVTKAEAWGYYLGLGNNNFFIEGNPYSYNDIIRADLGDSMIYNGMDTMANAMAAYNQQRQAAQQEDVALRGPQYNPAQDLFGCERASDEACNVSIDRYVY